MTSYVNQISLTEVYTVSEITRFSAGSTGLLVDLAFLSQFTFSLSLQQSNHF